MRALPLEDGSPLRFDEAIPTVGQPRGHRIDIVKVAQRPTDRTAAIDAPNVRSQALLTELGFTEGGRRPGAFGNTVKYDWRSPPGSRA